MKQFISFVRKEFIHILRDSRSLLILLIMPLVMVLLPGYVIKNDVKDIRVAVLDQSRDSYTQQIVRRIAENQYFIVKGGISTEEEATELFRKGDVDLVIVFGSGFANRLLHSQDATVQILSDGSEPNQASVRVAYVRQVLMAFQQEILEKMSAQRQPQKGRGGVSQMDIRVTTRMLYNPQQRSEVNFVPGVVGMIMLLICAMMTSVAIVRERETGTMEILLASPLPAIVIVLAKLVPYIAISFFNLATILCITNFIMDVPMTGCLLTYILVAGIYVFTCLMLGLLISCCVSTQLAAMLLSILLIVPTIYLSGMIFAVESMPLPAQMISNIVPAKWFITASRKIMIQGVEIQYVVKEMTALAVEGIVLMLMAWKLFKTRLE